MKEVDKNIIKYEVSAAVGKVISQWVTKNGVLEPVDVHAGIVYPTCYVDEVGVVHTGRLIVCDVEIHDSDDDDFNDED